jgi:hypothetical protein
MESIKHDTACQLGFWRALEQLFRSLDIAIFPFKNNFILPANRLGRWKALSIAFEVGSHGPATQHRPPEKIDRGKEKDPQQCTHYQGCHQTGGILPPLP